MAIAFISTGGTLANRSVEPLDYLRYLSEGEVLAGDDVLALLPDVSEIAEVVTIPFGTFRSKEISWAQWRLLQQRISDLLAREDISGVIIGHGTGVLEETAYFLHLTIDSDKPVVLIGAQRPAPTVSSDAAANFVDAVRYAADPAEHGNGVVVIMDQTVHSARDVAKLANHSLDAMRSPVAGPLGTMAVTGEFIRARPPLGRHTTTSEFATSDLPGEPPRVDIVSQYAGADRTAVDAFVAAGARGLIVVGFPPGTNTPSIDEALLEHAAAGVRIVQASRALDHPQVFQRPDLDAAGIVGNGNLSPQHARILLQLALMDSPPLAELQRIFMEY